MSLNYLASPSFGKTLDKVEKPLESNRDSAIASFRPKRGRPALYKALDIESLVLSCWMERERMCSKRLVYQLESWLQEHESKVGPVQLDLRNRFLSISASSIERILQRRRDSENA